MKKVNFDHVVTDMSGEAGDKDSSHPPCLSTHTSHMEMVKWEAPGAAESQASIW